MEPFRLPALKAFDESKHKRGKPKNRGQFASGGGGGGSKKPAGGGSSAQPAAPHPATVRAAAANWLAQHQPKKPAPSVSRDNPDLDAFMSAEPEKKPAPPSGDIRSGGPDIFAEAMSGNVPSSRERSSIPPVPKRGRKPNAKRLDREATARATEHLRAAGEAERIGDQAAASGYRIAGALYHAAAGHHSEGNHVAADFLKRTAEEYAAGRRKVGDATGTRQLSPQATPPAPPASPQSSQDKPQAPISPSGGPKAAPIYQSRTPARIHGTNGQVSSNGQTKPSPGTTPPPSGPPPLPHQRTAAAAIEHGNNLARAMRGGNRAEIVQHRGHFEQALKAHEAAGHAEIERRVRAIHGTGAKADRVIKATKAKFSGKLTAARQKIGGMAGKSLGFRLPPLVLKARHDHRDDAGRYAIHVDLDVPDPVDDDEDEETEDGGEPFDESHFQLPAIQE